MSGKRQERMERIRAVEREHQAAVKAVELLAERLRADPAFGADDEWRFRDARNLRANLEATFLIRLFAEFEAGLRDAWRNTFRRTTHPTMRDLLEAVARLRLIPQDWLDDAHEVAPIGTASSTKGMEIAAPYPSRKLADAFVASSATCR